MSIVKTKTQLIRDLVNCTNSMQLFASGTQAKIDAIISFFSDIVDAVVEEDMVGNWVFRRWDSGVKEFFSLGLDVTWTWTDIDASFSSGVAEVLLPEQMDTYTSLVSLSGDAPPMMLSTKQESNKIIIKAISLLANKPVSSAFNIVLYKFS